MGMKKVAILTSGGDAPGMNACIRAAVRYAIYNDYSVYGVEHGYQGLIDNRIFEMFQRSVSDIVHRGGTILKTARCVDFLKREMREIAVNNLRNRGINNLIVIGGDGSFKGALDLQKEFGINVVGIPGTIDNDLGYTDYTLGFDTAVNTALGAINNLRDTTASHDRVCIVEVMGRNCGDIALYAGLGGGAEYILIPEIKSDFQDIAERIKDSAIRGKTTNMIVFAEGAGDKNELIRTIKEVTGRTPTLTTLGYIQRGGTPTMADRILAARLAQAAVDVLSSGKEARVVGIKNNQIIDMDIEEACAVKDVVDKKLYDMARILSL